MIFRLRDHVFRIQEVEKPQIYLRNIFFYDLYRFFSNFRRKMGHFWLIFYLQDHNYLIERWAKKSEKTKNKNIFRTYMGVFPSTESEKNGPETWKSREIRFFKHWHQIFRYLPISKFLVLVFRQGHQSKKICMFMFEWYLIV